MIEKFKNWYERRHDYAREWKERTGGKVIGYFCTYVPEEILYAANMLPVRIFGSHEPQDITEPHIFGMFCPYCRDCLAQGLKGRYDYLNGIVIAQSCLHLRQTFTSWESHIPVDYSYYLPFPHGVQSKRAYPYLSAELLKFKKSLEGWRGKVISEKDLERAIKIYNKNRQLLRSIYELRKQENPPITGLDAMYMTISSQVCDKEEQNEVLEEVLKDLKAKNLKRNPGIRLMIVGSEDDDTEFLKMVESLGATFVIDDHCTGSRYFLNEVLPNEDKISALARRYLERPPCPNKDWPQRRRFGHILKLAKDYKAQGALLIQQKFCDPHELDIPPLKWFLEENRIPTYFLEFDVTVPVGQLQTRVEAFLEMLKAEDLF